MNVADFSKLDTESYSYAQLVKGIYKAKAILCPSKKATGSKTAKLVKSERAISQSQGRELVKSAIALMSAEGATSSAKLSTQNTGMLEESEKVIASPFQQQVLAKKTKKRKVSELSTSGTIAKAVTENSKEKQKISRLSGDKAIVLSEDELMEVENLTIQIKPPSENKGIAAKDEESKAMESLEIKKGYYPFGVDTTFSIDVMKCYPAPANYVYRKLNPDWVKILTYDFIEDTKQEEILAILMPINLASKTPLSALPKEDIHKVDYWIISGQHSISAAKRLQQTKSSKVTPLLQRQFKFRRSKIILNCPPKITREISKDANISVAKSMQKEPFLDQLMQARSQWNANGRPDKPPPSVHLSKAGDDFKSWKVL